MPLSIIRISRAQGVSSLKQKNLLLGVELILSIDTEGKIKKKNGRVASN